MKKLLPLFLLVFAVAAQAQLTAPAPQVLVPAAGSVAGLNGTFFRSDIAIYNYRETPQNVLVQWLPQGISGVGGQAKLITINALSGIISDDFVTNVLGQTGLGAVLITAVLNSGGDPDSAGALFVTSRIWSPQAGNPDGTVSQTLPTVDTSHINSNNVAILGQRVSEQFRTNIGIVNLSTSSQTFEVLQNSDDPTFAPVLQTVTIPARSMQQVQLLNARATALQVRVRSTSNIDARQWVSYGSTVDNRTGDSWSSLGVTTVVRP